MAHTRPDRALLLTPQECSFLDRQVRNTGRYAVFTAVDLCVALALAIWSLVDGALAGTRFALIILVLLHARANLKQHKDAKLLGKLQLGLARRREARGRWALPAADRAQPASRA